jgi:ssDNA-binding Zn-finger/Zn-ribbon topoisomerase 1
MRKLIEKQESLIECDNEKCDFTVAYCEEEEKHLDLYINLPCPKCGENLLTMEDYLQHQKLMRVVNFINRWFSWITIFYSKKNLDNGSTVSVHVHKGIKIEEIKK